MSNSLASVLNLFRNSAKTEREKGTYFEQLVQIYLSNEPKYIDLYKHVWMWEAWRKDWIQKGNQDPGKDTGIDLVAITHLGEYHAIQAKFWNSDRTLYKKDVVHYGGHSFMLTKSIRAISKNRSIQFRSRRFCVWKTRQFYQADYAKIS